MLLIVVTLKTVFMQRNINEIIESQKKMLIHRGEDPNKVPGDEIKDLFKKYLKILKHWIANQSNIEVLYVSYNDILRNPQENIKKINHFFKESLDEEKMAEAIDESLYRNRS